MEDLPFECPLSMRLLEPRHLELENYLLSRNLVNSNYISNSILKSTCHSSYFQCPEELVNYDSTFVYKQRQRITHGQAKASPFNRRRPRRKNKQIRLIDRAIRQKKQVKDAIRATVAHADEALPCCWPSIEQFRQ